MKPVEELNLVTIKAVIADMLEKGLVTSEYYKTIFYKFIALDESPQSEQEEKCWEEITNEIEKPEYYTVHGKFLIRNFLKWIASTFTISKKQ